MIDSKTYHKYLDRMEVLLAALPPNGQLPEVQQRELDEISDAVATYEETKYPFQAETLQEMIELRMYQRKLKQKDLAQLLNTSPSRISEILNGKRQLTLELAKGLYKKLNIDAELILGA